MDKSWHPEHFQCYGCLVQFSGSMSYREKDSHPYCDSCYTDMVLPKCGGCGKPITDRALKAFDTQWHVSCFVCSVGTARLLTFCQTWLFMFPGMQDNFWRIKEFLCCWREASVWTLCRSNRWKWIEWASCGVLRDEMILGLLWNEWLLGRQSESISPSPYISQCPKENLLFCI